MKLVVGLGNPGSEYSNTYHNMGFMALDAVCKALSVPQLVEKDNALVASIGSGNDKVIFCKPLTYMNRSGDAVGKLSRFYKIPSNDIIVLYDDIDIPKGTVRARLNGSAGTHNGMRDIVEKLGTTDFARVRIGIGKKPDYMDMADYVLSTVSNEWKEIVEKSMTFAADFACDWIKGKAWQTLTKTVSN